MGAILKGSRKRNGKTKKQLINTGAKSHTKKVKRGKPKGIQAKANVKSKQKKKVYSEEQIDKAFELLNDGKGGRFIERETTIPKGTTDYWKKKQWTKRSEIKTSGAKQYLDEATEDELVKWIEDMAEEHFAVTIPQFLELVEAIMKELKIPIRGESGHLSRHFVSDFVTRHPRIEDVFCQGLDDRREKNAKPETVNRFFDFVVG